MWNKYLFSNEDLSSATPLSYFQEDESTRAWGDELSGELLYTILLKRVRYSKNTNDGLQWETQKVKYSQIHPHPKFTLTQIPLYIWGEFGTNSFTLNLPLYEIYPYPKLTINCNSPSPLFHLYPYFTFTLNSPPPWIHPHPGFILIPFHPKLIIPRYAYSKLEVLNDSLII